MTNPRQNIEDLEAAKEILRDHPLCASFTSRAGYLFVKFPLGDFECDAVQVRGFPSQKVAIEKALEKMEEIWMRSYPGGAQCPS